ncbi:MAG: hypothetical protein H0U27_04035 [Nitrosopumilus sp.]|nr:hypothetical protein [Nitrosopumilus sp.]MBA3550653.1 hypothetical protein [Patescibacteria group bacterium]MDQ3077067.1 hypothetical protein [bacterium]
MKDENKVHATDTIKDLGEHAKHGKEGGEHMKATMQADYEQTKDDVKDMGQSVKDKFDGDDEGKGM